MFNGEIVLAVAELLAGLGAFLLGFNLLSGSMTKLAGGGLKNMLGKTVHSPLKGVGIGALSTAVMQSSSITTVMFVGFVNAGIMTLPQATALIMGSNIGSTITAQIAALQSIDIMSYLMLLACVGAFMNLFAKREKFKTLGLALGGLGLIFVGMWMMEGSMEIFKDDPFFQTAITSVTNPVLLLLIGAAVTALFQSSGAVTSIVISIAAAGITIGNGGNSVLFVIMGSNIGTCVTALLSAIGATANGKRASIIHLMFNTFGAVLFTVVLLIWKNFFEVTFQRWFTLPATQIAMFHTFFNVICTAIFLPFINVFVKISELVIKDKKPASSVAESDFMDERLLNTPTVALAQLSNEAVIVARKAFENLSTSFEKFLELDDSTANDIGDKTIEVEQTIGAMVNYLVKISSRNIGQHEEELINVMHHNLNDILRVNAFADNFVKYTAKSIKEDLTYSDNVKAQLRDMFDNITKLFELSVTVLNDSEHVQMDKVDEYEDKIDRNKNQLIDGHIERLNQGICQPACSGIFINLVSNLERAGDHLTYIAHSFDEINGKVNA
ncbi:MAG: Na/Pi cotransporter family protein [Clostridiales bacterium]|nr:Na/Pi cotransporter family protein [Eubacteriales bacterium]MDD6054652.1 Na/Pi cotransporter family protein [Clostridiales bacterium]MDD7506101.1 Na/Pi cotransporter family protein [Clostridiales bacterium]MDY5726263.1 Na/Pi cotransporter family protein [Eubacteriales bacterium]